MPTYKKETLADGSQVVCEERTEDIAMPSKASLEAQKAEHQAAIDAIDAILNDSTFVSLDGEVKTHNDAL